MASHKYLPAVLIKNQRWQPVIQYIFHPNGKEGSPVIKGMPSVECVTPEGSRWYGCKDAYIDSTLRMVIVGYEGAESTGWERPEGK